MIDRSVAELSIAPSVFAEPIYQHPREVLDDRTLTRCEKRALLASWASDAAAVPSKPSLRRLPGSYSLVSIDDILEALAALDDPPEPPGGKPARIGDISRLSSLPLAA